MTKKVIKLIIAICVLISIVLFSNLPERMTDIIETFENKSTVSSMLGRWERNEGKGIQKLEFFNDGTYTSDHPNYNGNYSINGHRLKLSGILVDPLVYSFEIENNELILTPDSGEIRVFAKIKE